MASAQGRLRVSAAPCRPSKTGAPHAARQCKCRVAQDEQQNAIATVPVSADTPASASDAPQASMVPSSWHEDAIPYMLALASLFTIFAIDVNVESSAHLLSGVDSVTHNAVASTVPYDWRALADGAISDLPITVCSLAAVAGVAAITMISARQGLAVGAVMLAANAAVGGVFLNKDAIVTTALKRAFHRARPTDDLHHSFSFPSGHSTSVYFVAGFLFCIVIPLLHQVFLEDSDEADSGIKQTLAHLSQPKVAIPLTIACGATTQSGRILADVHWVSDTLAGACLGSMGVLASWVILAKWRERFQQGMKYLAALVNNHLRLDCCAHSCAAQSHSDVRKLDKTAR
eukprot:TRINITY_DN808_c0_g1_i7.p1 TRINITY_DN808_c0_g1~~TRINITY_DN808_c0_g1_i7.p1  ORF type:complete len:344 (-),score=29.40 TRINITY_DN808_c0_g1_i7:235-1266(-)